MHHIAENERQKLIKDLETAKFLSMISDGTTDSAVKEAEIVYVRYAVQGVIHVAIVGVKNVAKADATGIKTAIENAMKEYLGIEKSSWMKRLVGFGSDGAAVMIGKNSGVARKLKDEQPCVQSGEYYSF